MHDHCRHNTKSVCIKTIVAIHGILKWQLQRCESRIMQCSGQDQLCMQASLLHKSNTNMFSPWTGNDTGNSAYMLHSILKQDQIHDCIGLVVLIQSLHARSKVGTQLFAILTVVSWTAQRSSLVVSISTSCQILLCKLIFTDEFASCWSLT